MIGLLEVVFIKSCDKVTPAGSVYTYSFCSTIDSCDIEIPMLEIGEEFFLSDITKTVRIKSRMRSSDGSITYYVEDEFVETENTKSSYEKCMEFVSNYSNRVESEITALRTDFEEYKKKYKYKHRFFNF